VPPQGSNKKVANSLLALSSAAVLGVYSAGYIRTRAAADRFALQAEMRRPAIPAPSAAAPPTARDAVVTPVPAKTAIADKRADVPARPRKKAERPPTAAAVPSVPALAAPAADAPLALAGQSIEVAAPPPAAPAKPVYKDGTYLGWGTSRHGDIQAQVVIENGRIASATIAQCLTRYSCSVIAALPPQVAQRQSPETDYVSGATQSTNAFYYAVVEALSKAK